MFCFFTKFNFPVAETKNGLKANFFSHFAGFNLKNNVLNVNFEILDNDKSKGQEKTFSLVTVYSSFHSFKDKIGEFKDGKSSKATLAKRCICAKYLTSKNY